MPTFNGEQLFQIATRILQGAGVSQEEADLVATELREANAVGHDSHGVMRLVQYVDYVEQGFIKPGGKFRVVKEGGGFGIVDGNFNFGQVTATKALELAMGKARFCGTGTIMIQNCNHVGRLGSYSQKAARQGFAAMMTVNAPGPGGVAVYGGMDKKLGTNPITIAAPWGDDALVLDMTTSASAEGKVRVAFQKGEQVPEGWLIDSEGHPTTDPATFYEEPGGAILPLGGPLGFKGFGMSVMIDVFSGMLSGSGVCRTDLPRGANGVWMYVVDVAQFIGRDEYDALMEKYVAYIKDAKKLPGVEEILMPGEIELARKTQRERDGVAVPDETWRQLCELAERVGASVEDV